ncbi:MAG: hypothetical protein RJB02_1359 [Pseudomonadota bacterium]|jgi:hypothetical protein
MAERYPKAPGAKSPDGTSEQAAGAIKPCASHLRRIATFTLNELGEATVLKAVAHAALVRESLQLRFSELRAMGLVEPTGQRRRNPSGKSASVLRLTQRGQQVVLDG